MSAIACAGEQIWVARTGDVGSIGVVYAHFGQSKADEKAGYQWTFIYEGNHKTHGNPHEPLADEALNKIQADCALLNGMFVKLVTDYRPMSAAQVRATKAETFIGNQAVLLGLADYEGTFEQALQSLARSVDTRSTPAPTLMNRRGTCPAAVIAQKTEKKNSKTNCRRKTPRTRTSRKANRGSIPTTIPVKELDIRTVDIGGPPRGEDTVLIEGTAYRVKDVKTSTSGMMKAILREIS